jgi:preprotein translocase subunit YajC
VPEEVIVLGILNPVLAADSGSGSAAGFLIPLLLMGFIFYFLLIRPQRRQRQAHQRLIDSVDVGDEVVTIGGMFGTVKSLDDESLTVEVAPNVDIRFSRGAIARKLVYDEEYEDASDIEDQDEPEDDEPDEEPEVDQQPSRTGPWFSRSGRRRGRKPEAGDQS